MRFISLSQTATLQSFSYTASLNILNRYKSELTDEEYKTILKSLSSLAIEGIYLNEKDILISIAQLRGEIELDEIIKLAKSA